MELTQEQQTIAETRIKKGEMLKVVAKAGTGKTSSLVAYSEANPCDSIIYLAFNKMVATEAESKFPNNVIPKTVHALAWKDFGSKYKGYNEPKFYHVRRKFKLDVYAATLVIDTLNAWLNSADDTLEQKHAAPDKQNKYKKDISESLCDYAKQLWAEMIKGVSPFPMSHSGYLKLYQLSKPKIPFGTILLDESQDTNPVTWNIIERQRQYGTKIILVGDSHQKIYCQPAGTMVTATDGYYQSGKPVNYKQSPIEQLKIGDKVVSYSIAKGYGHRTGCSITDIQTFNYSGQLITVKANGLKTKYTPEHHCVVRIGEIFKGKFVVYVMQRGINFRVGRTSGRYSSQRGQVGVSIRSSQEKASSMWIIGVYDTVKEAALTEAYLAWKFGVPTLTFVASKKSAIKQSGLDYFWKQIGANGDRASLLLQSVGMNIEFPLWSRKLKNLLIRRPFVTAACNLITGMKIMPISAFTRVSLTGRRISKSTWVPITVSQEHYKGKIYSLAVEKDHTYFADGILTHNSWRGATDIMKAQDCQSLLLTKSFRFGKNIASVANTLLRTFFQEQVPIVGNGNPDMIVNQMPESEPYTVICRTNVELFNQVLKAALAGKSVHVIGERGFNDYLTALVDIYYLSIGQHDKIVDKTLTWYKSFLEFKSFAADRDDLDLLSKINIVEKHSNSIPKYTELIKNKTASEGMADVIAVTAHKSKGLEWDNVVLPGDYTDLYDDNEQLVHIKQQLALIPGIPERERKKMMYDAVEEDEINLVYVAVTRAKQKLQLNNQLRKLLYKQQLVNQQAPVVIAASLSSTGTSCVAAGDEPLNDSHYELY